MPVNIRRRRFALTFFTPPDFDIVDSIGYFLSAEEKCQTTGNIHWQSYIEINKIMGLSAIKQTVNDQKVHVEVCKGNQKKNIDYCKKGEQSHAEWVAHGIHGPNYGKNLKIYREFGAPKEQGQRTDINQACEIIKTLKRPRDGYECEFVRPIMAKYPKFYEGYFRHTHVYTEPYNPRTPWQREVIEIVSGEPYERKIHWYWSEKGRMGKTTLCRALVDHHGACFLGTGHNNVLHAYKEEPVAVFNFPRDTDQEHVSYTAMESLKDGIYFSPKYDSHFKRFKPPHVFVFCNFAPDESKLSPDRLIITNVD